jgi:hypothetical protein
MAINCRTFPGSTNTDRIVSSSTVDLTSPLRSLAMWVNLNSLDATSRRCLTNTFDDYSVSNLINFRVSQGFSDPMTVTWRTNAAPSTGSWLLIASAYDGSNVNNDPIVWFNSTTQTMILITARSVGTLNTGSATQYLGNVGTFDRCLDGSLSLVARWSGYLLTQTDVTNLAAGTAPCAIQPDKLILYYPFDQGQSPEYEYVSGNSGTVTGTTVGTGPTVSNVRCVPFVKLEIRAAP